MSVRRIFGISLATDELATSLGASILLDKAELSRTLLPTILGDSAGVCRTGGNCGAGFSQIPQ
jgi:hypothetical protein